MSEFHPEFRYASRAEYPANPRGYRRHSVDQEGLSRVVYVPIISFLDKLDRCAYPGCEATKGLTRDHCFAQVVAKYGDPDIARAARPAVYNRCNIYTFCQLHHTFHVDRIKMQAATNNRSRHADPVNNVKFVEQHYLDFFAEEHRLAVARNLIIVASTWKESLESIPKGAGRLVNTLNNFIEVMSERAGIFSMAG